MALDTQKATALVASETLIIARDANHNAASAHVNVGADGTERGIQGSPFYVAQTLGPWAVSWAGQSVALAAGSTVALSAGSAVTVSGFVAVTGTFFQPTQPISATALPLPAGAAQDGTDATGVTVPAGGAGIRGWLSGIYSKLAGTLTVAVQGTVPVSGMFYPASQAVTLAALPALPAGTNTIGSVNVNGTQTVVVANGPLTYAAPASGSVGASSAPLVTAGAYTNLIIITTAPTSAGNVFLGIGVAAVAGSGFCVPAGGGSFTFSKTGPVPLPASGQAINAISDSGTVAVSIQGA